MKKILLFSILFGFCLCSVKAQTGNSYYSAATADSTGYVTTGYRDIRKDLFTGASSHINGSDLGVSAVPDVSRLLDGQAAGVSVRNVSNTFGAAPQINIRGINSIYGDNKPIWVVDGFILDNIVDVSDNQLSGGDPVTLLVSAMAGINVNDIESIEILKDASATSIYGAQGRNGVIVVTTRKGALGGPRVSYSGNFSMRFKPYYGNYDILNSAEQMGVFSELASKGALKEDILNARASGVYGIMYRLMDTYNPETHEFMMPNTPEARNAFLYKHAVANTDWFDVLFRNTLVQEHSISISGGTEKWKGYASAGLYYDPGWTVADKTNRYTFNLRNDFTINRKLNFSIKGYGSIRDQQTPGAHENKAGIYGGYWPSDFNINPFSYALGTSRTIRPYGDDGELEYIQMNYAPFNILEELEENRIKAAVSDLRVNGNLNYEIVKGLKYSISGGIRHAKSAQAYEITERSNIAEAHRAMDNVTIANRNPLLWWNLEDPNPSPVSVLPEGGFRTTDNVSITAYNIRQQLSYNNVWGKHEIYVHAGAEIKWFERKRTEKLTPGYIYSEGGRISIDDNFRKMLSNYGYHGGYYGDSYPNSSDGLYWPTENKYRYADFFGNASYAYDNRYIIDASVSYNVYNIAESDKRWAPTWSVGGRWNISREAFMKSIRNIDILSLRASYGEVKSLPLQISIEQPLNRPQSIDTGRTNIDMPYYSKLDREKISQFNIGLDLSMYKGRLNFSADYYNKEGADLIAPAAMSITDGKRTELTNKAGVHTYGFEATLEGVIIGRREWTWSAGATFGHSKSKIKNLEKQLRVDHLLSVTGGNKEGYPVGSIFSVPFAKLNGDTGLPLFIIDSDGTLGMDISGQSMATDFLKYEGSCNPTYFGAFNTVLRWKNTSIDLTLTYSGGNKVRLDRMYNAYSNDIRSMPGDMATRWTLPGDELITNIPVILSLQQRQNYTIINAYYYYNYSTERIANGDYIKLKNITVTYDFPARWLKALKIIEKASLSVTGRDLWTIYSDDRLKGMDPEYYNSGGVAMPAAQTVIFSLNIGF